MRQPRTGPRYTDIGKCLYHRYVGITLEEYPEGDFIRKFLMGEPTAEGNCYWCGCQVPLILGAFCLRCTRGSWVIE